MSTGLTVADARAQTYMQIDPSDPNSTTWLVALNQVCKRIIESGQWKNMYGQVDYQSTTGYITLPRQWEAIIGVTRVNRATGVYPRMSEFMTSGPGFLDDTSRNLHDILDDGDCCTQVYQEDIGFPSLTITDATDAGEDVRLYGHDANGFPIFDANGVEGIELTLANPTVTAAVEMFVTQIVKPATEGNVTLNVIVSGSPVQLSVYQPSETNPIYRRYKVGTITARQDNKPVLRCLCKRRFIQMVHETDLVWPDNVGALKFGLIAWTLENQGAHELQNANLFWGKCYEVLNQGLKQNRGAIRPTMPFWYPQSAGQTPRTH